MAVIHTSNNKTISCCHHLSLKFDRSMSTDASFDFSRILWLLVSISRMNLWYRTIVDFCCSVSMKAYFSLFQASKQFLNSLLRSSIFSSCSSISRILMLSFSSFSANCPLSSITSFSLVASCSSRLSRTNANSCCSSWFSFSRSSSSPRS